MEAMDRHGVAIGLVGLGNESTTGPSSAPRPLRPEPGSRPQRHRRSRAARIRRPTAHHGIIAVTTFPAGCNPQVPVSDRRYYPIYQTCVDLDIPIVANAGIAGPRVPSACQT